MFCSASHRPVWQHSQNTPVFQPSKLVADKGLPPHSCAAPRHSAFEPRARLRSSRRQTRRACSFSPGRLREGEAHKKRARVARVLGPTSGGSAPREAVLGQIRRGGKADWLLWLGHPMNMPAQDLGPRRSAFGRTHHRHEAAEQEMAIARAGRSLRMILHREDRPVFERQSAV